MLLAGSPKGTASKPFEGHGGAASCPCTHSRAWKGIRSAGDLEARLDGTWYLELLFAAFFRESLLELGKGRLLDLADPLAGQTELAADLVKGHGVALVEAEPEAQDCGLALADGAQQRRDALEVGVGRRRAAVAVLAVGPLVGDLARGGPHDVQAHRPREVLGGADRALEDLDALLPEAHLDGGLGDLGDAAVLLEEAVLEGLPLGDDFDQVRGQAHGLARVDEGAAHGLLDPPRGVRREPALAGGVEFLDRVEEAEVALLDEVEERESSIREVLRDRNHQSEVRADELLAGLQGVLLLLGLRGVDLPHPPGQRHLLAGREQRNRLNFLEVLFDSGLLSNQACQCHVASHYTVRNGRINL